MRHGYHEDPYVAVMGVISSLPNAREGFRFKEAKDKLELKPGLFFTPGTTWDDIFRRLVAWRWLDQDEDIYRLT